MPTFHYCSNCHATVNPDASECPRCHVRLFGTRTAGGRGPRRQDYSRRLSRSVFAMVWCTIGFLALRGIRLYVFRNWTSDISLLRFYLVDDLVFGLLIGAIIYRWPPAKWSRGGIYPLTCRSGISLIAGAVLGLVAGWISSGPISLLVIAPLVLGHELGVEYETGVFGSHAVALALIAGFYGYFFREDD